MSNYLVAKTRGRKPAYYIILEQEEELYTIPSISKTHVYLDDYKLEDNEWFLVEEFSKQHYGSHSLLENFDNTAYSSLPSGHYSKLEYIVAVQGDIFAFQRIVSSKVFQKKLICFNLDESPQMLDSRFTIVINKEPDAIYDKSNDKLYFKNLSSLTSIFQGIDVLYREATEEETQTFLSLKFLKINPGFQSNNVKTANRRRIKSALEKYNAFQEDQKAKLPNYLKQYCGEDLYDEETESFVIGNEEQLTKVLNGINQRYYTTEIDGEKMLANSVTPL